MEKVTPIMSPNARHFKNSGEVTYLISPLRERTPSPLYFSGKEETLKERFFGVRNRTLTLCKPLNTEDLVFNGHGFKNIKWMLTHTTWLIEKMLLRVWNPKYKPLYEELDHIFGDLKGEKTYFSRPTIDAVFSYRRMVNDEVEKLIEKKGPGFNEDKQLEFDYLLEFLLNIEKEYQEEILTQIKKRLFAFDFPQSYLSEPEEKSQTSRCVLPPVKWVTFKGGLVNIGNNGQGFATDMEMPRHTRYIEPFMIAQRPVTNGEFLQFIEDGGYERGGLWLADGWKMIQEEQRAMPRYWRKKGSQLKQYTLSGLHPLRLNEPVCHLSFFEADAYARYAGARLPTESEWETASATIKTIKGNFFSTGQLHPSVLIEEDLKISSKLKAMFGDVWEWTSSLYTPYPNYHPLEASLWKYTGRCEGSKRVVRGGSCLYDGTHFRPTMRKPLSMFSSDYCTGIRLVKNLK